MNPAEVSTFRCVEAVAGVTPSFSAIVEAADSFLLVNRVGGPEIACRMLEPLKDLQAVGVGEG